MNFYGKLQERWQEGKFVCVGLDPVISKLPRSILDSSRSPLEAVVKFNFAIIEATHEHVCAYKPNSAFFEALGDEGLYALHKVVNFAKKLGAIVICDSKRGDIGNTNSGYVESVFDIIGADAITINPYLGQVANEPFLERKDKGVIVLVRTSNKGAGEFQDLLVDGEPLYINVAENVYNSWNYNENCAIVVGATYPDELKRIRAVIGDMPILIPGVGAQGGDLEASVKNGMDSSGEGLTINLSRGIIYANSGKNFAKAAAEVVRDLNVKINQYRGA